MGMKDVVTRQLAPRIMDLAPGLSTGFVREALNRAIDGVGPLQPAGVAADAQLREQGGNVERAIHEVIENNVRLAAGQGFLTNLGGLVTAAVAIPANIAGLAVIQCRMVAGIAHLRGHDLSDPRVRNAILALLLGEEEVESMLEQGRLPARPMQIATAAKSDPVLDSTLASVVASTMVARMAGRRMATTIGRKVPVVGGLVGFGADAYATWRVGRYADRELLPRTRR